MPAVDGQLFIENEGTPGTYDAPDGADAIHCEAFEWSKAGAGIQQRNKKLGTQERSAFPYAPPNIFANVKFTTEIKAQTDATTPGELAALWQSAGLTQTVGGSDVTYSQIGDPNAAANDISVSYLFEESVDGNQYTGAGARFGWEIRGSWDKPPMVTWSGVSSYRRPADVSSLTSPTYHAGAPFVALQTTGNPFRFHSYDMIVRSFTIRGAVRPTPRPSMGDAVTFGYKWPCHLAWPDDAAVSGEFEIELVDQAAFGLWAKFEAPTGGSDGAIIFAAGSRLVTLDCDDTIFDAPARVAGQPNMWRLPFWVYDFNVVYA